MGESIPVTSNTIDANVRKVDKLVTEYVEGLGSREPKKPTPPEQNPEVSDGYVKPPAPPTNPSA